MVKYTTPTIVLFFVFHLSICQNYVDILNTNAGILPAQGFVDSSETNATQIHAFNLLIPVPVNDSVAILFGFNYVYNSVHLGINDEQQAFKMVAPRLGLNVKHNNKWSSTYLIHGRFNSDRLSIKNKGFQYGLMSQFKYAFHKDKSIKFGVYLNRDVFGWFTTPVFCFYYRSPNKKFETDLILPIYSKADYKLTNWLRIGADIFTAVRSYELNRGEFSDYYIHNAFNEISSYLQFDLLKEQLLIKLKGIYAYHDYALYRDGDEIPLGITGQYINDQRERLNAKLTSSLGFRVALTYRFHLQ
jgi:hypothetical protein